MTELEKMIRAEITAKGPMRFDRFMAMALYQPGLGYYAKAEGPVPIGRTGDFYTSVSVGPLFGKLLARQFWQMWQVMGKPEMFWLMEQGAHDGQLACDILDWCRMEVPEFYKAIRYVMVGAATGAKATAEIQQVENLAALAEQKPSGVFFSNELVDAFPVRVIIRRGEGWRERVVSVKNDLMAWDEQEINDEELSEMITSLPLPTQEGYVTEINLAARHWMEEVAAVVGRGYVLTIDYGYPASIYYADFRPVGTLTAYRKHQRSDDLLADPGEQDLTAHVDFSALVRAGQKDGLAPLGFLDQQRFLMGVAHDELSGSGGPAVKLQEHLRAWNTLTHPQYLGAKFQVLLQVKDAPAGIDGLRFARPGGLD